MAITAGVVAEVVVRAVAAAEAGAEMAGSAISRSPTRMVDYPVKGYFRRRYSYPFAPFVKG